MLLRLAPSIPNRKSSRTELGARVLSKVQRKPGDPNTSDPDQRMPLVYWLDEETIAIDWYGHVDDGMCLYALTKLSELTREKAPLRFFSDTVPSSGYDPRIRRLAAEILMHIRATGVKELVGVFDSQAIQMFAAAVSFVTGLRLKAFTRREDALAYIRTPRS